MKNPYHQSDFDACIAEGWEIENNNVFAYGTTFPIVAPLSIHLKSYRTHASHQTRYNAMRRSFEILWPQHIVTYNQWTERIFYEHCDWDTDVFTLAAGGGVGKGLPLDTPIKTPSGWTLLKDLTVNQIICDTQGSTQHVTGIYPQGIRPIYRVHFSDQTSTVCDDQHLWTVYSAKQRDNITGPQTISTLDIIKNIKKDFSLPGYSPTEGTLFPYTIHPYVMGFLLGNGSLTTNNTCGYTADKTCLDKIQSLADTTTKWIEKDNCWRISFLGMHSLCEVKAKAENKYIPKQYLYGVPSDRLQLLHGLMDTDGYCGKNGTASYTTVSPQLKEDVLELARSMGFMCTVSSKIPTYRYKGERKTGQRAYTIIIRRTKETKNIPLFTVPHKLERDSRERRQYAHRRIIKIEHIGEEPTACIKVSNPNNLFVIKDHVVTHNTWAAAYMGSIFWISFPHKNTVIVTSTTLDSLKSRIYGYILRALKETAIAIPMGIKNTPPPSINPVPADFIHGIYGIAAKQGTDEEAIKNIIGRHPQNSLLLILDEAPDMPIAIMGAFPNLKKGLVGRFQACAIGNAASTDDLHGALSTPKVGWENIDPKTTYRWPTTQPNGVCLYFNPYDSPAIHETDPDKKAALSKFLITTEKLIAAEQAEGTESEAFWRFTMGFWRSRSTNKTIVSEEFLRDYDPTHPAEFSGRENLVVCAGLDPAFSVGGDKCILRLAILGHHTNGSIVLDYKGPSFIFDIQIKPNTGKSAEIQIADQVIEICKYYNVPLNTLCIDASGAGRGLADVIYLRSGGMLIPTKMYSTNIGKKKVQQLDIIISSAFEQWTTGRQFINHRQIYGMDPITYTQLYSRLIVEKNGKKHLEDKNEYKKRMSTINSSLGRSPDEADAAMLCLQSAILHHGFFCGQTRNVVRYGNKESEEFDKARRSYIEIQEKMKQRAGIKPTYSKGLISVINRRSI